VSIVGFMPGGDAEQYRSVVRGFLAVESSEARVRQAMDTESGFDPKVWARAAEQLGLPGLAVPEQYGGAGAGLTELGVVFEEAGRALLCAPLLASVGLAATGLMAAASEDAKDQYLPPIAAGESIATLAWDGPSPATSSLWSDHGRITGTAGYVLGGGAADVVVVAARDGQGLGLYVVDGDAEGLSRTPLTTMDSTRRLARLRFDDTPAVLVGTDVAEPIARAFDISLLLLAAEQVGGAQAALDSAVGYARQRIQFGRPIGSFQAVKHRCADMLMDVELARSLAYHGLATAADDSAATATAASLARSFCSDAYAHVAAANLQIHGGIGFTWEHSAHLYLKRARSSALLFGTPTAHRRRLAEQLGLGAR